MGQPIAVLFVDDDSDFCEFVATVSKSFNVNLKICNSFQCAKKNLSEHDFDAYILDAALPDGSGFDLATMVRTKHGQGVPIIVFSGVYRDTSSLRKLKEELDIFFVIDKPIRSDEIEAIFESVCNQTAAKSESINPSFQEVKARYDKTIVYKIEQLEKLILLVKADPSPETISALKGAVHKICGSASSFGYPAVSELCHSLERYLAKILAHIDLVYTDTKWHDYLDDFFRQIKIDFQHLH